jgi:dethiobiotin synthetase
MRIYVTGTDTGVGKTRVAAALAAAARRTAPTTVVKLVQTGLGPGEPGDAALAAELAGCAARELTRFAEPADPWSAALAAGCEPPDARRLAAALDGISGSLVVEGSGGAAVPLNATETITDAARYAACDALLVVGLRLGCINHARLTLAFLAQAGMRVRGAVLSECWTPTGEDYRGQVRRGLAAQVEILGLVRYDPEARRSVAEAAELFTNLGGMTTT